MSQQPGNWITNDVCVRESLRADRAVVPYGDQDEVLISFREKIACKLGASGCHVNVIEGRLGNEPVDRQIVECALRGGEAAVEYLRAMPTHGTSQTS